MLNQELLHVSALGVSYFLGKLPCTECGLNAPLNLFLLAFTDICNNFLHYNERCNILSLKIYKPML